MEEVINNTPEKEDRPKKNRLSSPVIDKCLQLKWGLALLGEERSREYLEWLREKIARETQQ